MYTLDDILKDQKSAPIDNSSLLLDMATNLKNEKGIISFMLVASMNSYPYSIYKWCDSESNFIGLSYISEFDEQNGEMLHTSEYTYDELPIMVKNATEYLNDMRKMEGCEAPSALDILPILSESQQIQRLMKIMNLKNKIDNGGS